MRRLGRLLENREGLSFVAVLLFCVFGYLNSPLWMAFMGGALFGVPSMVELVLLKERHPSVPTNWRVLSFYVGAVGNGVCAAVAGFFMG